MSAYLTITAASTLYYTKTYIDATFATIASLSNYVTNSSLATTLTSYYTKTTSDARYYLNTVELNNITLATGNLSVNNHKITDCLDPVNNLDVANKQWTLAQTGGSFTQGVADTLYYKLAGANTVTADLDMGTHKINNLVTPALATDAANKSYVDAKPTYKSAYVVIGTL